MADPSVQAIIEALQAGTSSEDNFRRLCDLYGRRLYHFFGRRGFSREDCLDLTQETFLGIYRGIGSFRREAGFETWLFKVATNVFRKRLRRDAADKRAGQEVSLEESDDPEEPARELAAPGPQPGEDALRRERSRVVRQAIEKLPDQMRKCLLLRVDQDLKYREIAALLRLSPETVKVHLFHARRRLQHELGSYFADSPDGGDGGEEVVS